jgi:hypothetical protein
MRVTRGSAAALLVLVACSTDLDAADAATWTHALTWHQTLGEIDACHELTLDNPDPIEVD